MRIATFNINNVNARLDARLSWLAETEPDVVCLQELKAEQGAFPADVLEQLGYGAAWKGERSWNGVAILARGATPVLTRASLPGDPADRQARYIEAAVGRGAGRRRGRPLGSGRGERQRSCAGVDRVDAAGVARLASERRSVAEFSDGYS